MRTTIQTDGSSLSIAQRLSLGASLPQNTWPDGAKKKAPPPRAAAGFLLLDSSMRPISFNAEAVQVLSYPDRPESVKRPGVFIAGKVRSRLISEQPSDEGPLV